MTSLPVKTPVEVLEELRKLVLKNSDARAISIYVFGWAFGVCLQAGVTLDELAFTSAELIAFAERSDEKMLLFKKWHDEQTKPVVDDIDFLVRRERSLRPPGEPE
jgi:hypothetical protein